jgi:hypothetical protein
MIYYDRYILILFEDDYRTTACISLVRYFVQKYESIVKAEKEEKKEKKPDKEVLRCYYQPISKPQMLSDISINTQVAPTTTSTPNALRLLHH